MREVPRVVSYTQNGKRCTQPQKKHERKQTDGGKAARDNKVEQADGGTVTSPTGPIAARSKFQGANIAHGTPPCPCDADGAQ